VRPRNKCVKPQPRISLDRGCWSRITAQSWSYDTHGCTHAFTKGYTTVDAMLESVARQQISQCSKIKRHVNSNTIHATETSETCILSYAAARFKIMPGWNYIYVAFRFDLCETSWLLHPSLICKLPSAFRMYVYEI